MHAELMETPTSLREPSYRPAALMAWVDDERLALADRDAGKFIYVNVQSGTEERFGRRGMGPGEMTLPFSILSRDGEGVLLADGMATRVTHFDKDGRAAETALFPGRPLALLGWDGNRVTAAWVDMETNQPVVGDVSLDGERSRARFRPFAVSDKVAASARSPVGPSQFVSATMDEEGRVLLGGGTTYEVFRFDSANRIEATFTRPDLAPERMTDQEFAEFSQRVSQVLSAGGEKAMAERDGVLALFREKPKPFFRMGALPEGPTVGGDDVNREWHHGRGRLLAGWELPVHAEAAGYGGDRCTAAALLSRAAAAGGWGERR
jgi:hypothetical protein